MDTVSESFTGWLNSVMDERGWSQADLSRATGHAPAVISNIVNGKRAPGAEVCISIARALHISPVQVMVKAGILSKESIDYKISDDIAYKIDHLSKENQGVILTMLDALIDKQNRERRAR